jgi:hypothetical protein
MTTCATLVVMFRGAILIMWGIARRVISVGMTGMAIFRDHRQNLARIICQDTKLQSE